MDQNPEGQGQKSVVGNNQPNPTPAAPSGAIFSGSSAPTGTAPANTPNQPTSDRSRPFFAHHPAHTFSREMGDIVVGGTPQKKSKKPLIIGGIVAAVLVILGTIAAVVISQTMANDARRGAFSAYANFIISGEEGNGQLPPLNANTAEYRIYTITYTDDETQSAYFNRLNELSRSLAESGVSASLSSENQASLATLTSSVQTWQEAFTFYDTQEEIVSAYAEYGSDGVQQLAQEMYSTLTSSNNSNISSVGEMLIGAQRYRISFFEQLNEQGCLPSDTSETCTAVAANLEANSGLGTQLEELVERARSQAARQLDSVLPTMWTIADNLEIRSQE